VGRIARSDRRRSRARRVRPACGAPRPASAPARPWRRGRRRPPPARRRRAPCRSGRARRWQGQPEGGEGIPLHLYISLRGTARSMWRRAPPLSVTHRASPASLRPPLTREEASARPEVPCADDRAVPTLPRAAPHDPRGLFGGTVTARSRENDRRLVGIIALHVVLPGLWGWAPEGSDRHPAGEGRRFLCASDPRQLVARPVTASVSARRVPSSIAPFATWVWASVGRARRNEVLSGCAVMKKLRIGVGEHEPGSGHTGIYRVSGVAVSASHGRRGGGVG